VSYPVWTSKSLQYGLVHVARTQWLPKIQAAKGAKATGTIAPAIANPPGAQLVGVQFATDRKRATDNTFTKHGVATIQEMTWGRALVSIPNTRKRAELPRPPGILGFHLPEDSRKHMMVHSLALMDRNQFIAEAASDEDQAFLFVHGYNTPFESGLRRTAQLAVDLGFQKNVFHYAWPSAGNLLGYNHDQNAVRAAQTPFLHFLETLLDDVGIKGLNVVAHSLGNDLALESFAHLATIRKTKLARHLVLASPDVALNVARPLLSLIPAVVDSMTLYANNHDRALFVSRAKSGNERIGGYLNDNYPHIQAGLDTIDAADANFDIFGLNHDAYIDSPILIGDLEALLMRGTRPPNIRNPVIREVACPRGDYFKIDT
jgi:esterase/lipase superfamily enzyme